MDRDDMTSGDYQAYGVPVLTPSAPPRYGVIVSMGWYALPFLLFDGGMVFLLQMRILSPLQVVFFVYTTNFIAFPALNLLWWGGKMLLRTTASGGRARVEVHVGLSLLLLAIFEDATFIEPNAIQVEKIDLFSDKVSAPVRILHISDIQTNSVGKYEQKVFRLMQQLNPDLILETGDAVQVSDPQKREQELQKLAALFRQLRPKYGIFTVMGDTDWRLEPEIIRQLAKLSGIKVLMDESAFIRAGGGQFRILGLSRGKSRRGAKALIEDWLKNTSNTREFTIVMGHAPDYILDLLDLKIDLCLAGHTHGGQVRIPFLGPIITLSKIPRAWAMGYREVGALRMNVSSGIGTEHLHHLPAIRFNCPPTMTLLTVRPLGKTTTN